MNVHWTVPNKRGQVICIHAATGRSPTRGQHRVYYGRSSGPRLDPRADYDAKTRADLQALIAWDIEQVFPQVDREGSWERTLRCKIGLSPEIPDAWPVLKRAILERFSTPSRVTFSIDLIDEQATG